MTWEPGDLAQVVNDRAFTCDHGVKRRGYPGCAGRVRTVRAIRSAKCGCTVLVHEAGHALASRYRKIPPLTRDEHNQFLADLDYDADVLALRDMYRGVTR